MDIYGEIVSALATEERVMLATIISTTGSTPAAALSKMIVRQGGAVSAGTIGGGCMEGDVVLQARRLEGTGRAGILTFHLNEDDAEHGLICGGTLSVLIEPVVRSQAAFFKKVQSIVDEGSDCVIATFLQGGAGTVGWKELVDPHSAGKSPGGSAPPDAGTAREGVRLLSVAEFARRVAAAAPGIPEETLGASLLTAFRRQETVRLPAIVAAAASAEEGGGGNELLLEPVAGRPRLIIFGGGHVSKYVSRIAAMAGYHITIVDDREKFANPVRFPEAGETLVSEFDGAFSSLNVTPATALLIVTRGHRYDTLVLGQALKTQARYIGMIGSKRKVLAAYEQLRRGGGGISDEELRRVHAPVGLDIGAVSAEEIAVSIVAELIASRRQQQRLATGGRADASGAFHRSKSDEIWKNPA